MISCSRIYSDWQVSESGPGVRYKHSAVITASGRMWIFGGEGANDSDSGDLWHIDLEADSPTWSQHVASGPAARRNHKAVITTSDHMWIFGGVASGVGLYDDLWYIDLQAGSPTWNQVTVSGPVARQAHSAVVTAVGCMWIFAGYAQTALDDLWYIDLDGSRTWSQVNASGPQARLYHSAVITGSGQMWIFGGRTGTSAPLGDLWRIDLEDTRTWAEALRTFLDSR